MQTGSLFRENFRIALLSRRYRPVDLYNFPRRCSGQKVEDVAVVANKN